MNSLYNSLLASLDIKLLLLDVDGVMTNGVVYYFDNSMEGKGFNTQDGMGLKKVMAAGITVGVISGQESPATKNRLLKLGIENFFLGVGVAKLPYYQEIRASLAINDENILCVGDDYPDVPLMRAAGFSVAVANAWDEVKASANYVTTLKGGEGAVREVCELLLQSRVARHV